MWLICCCTALPCVIPSIPNGYTDTEGVIYYMDTTAMHCNGGYQLNVTDVVINNEYTITCGVNQVICLLDGDT